MPFIRRLRTLSGDAVLFYLVGKFGGKEWTETAEDRGKAFVWRWTSVLRTMMIWRMGDTGMTRYVPWWRMNHGCSSKPTWCQETLSCIAVSGESDAGL